MRLGERGYTMERLYNLREGLTKNDDALPDRLTKTPQDPNNPKTIVNLEKMLPVYYRVRGWNPDGDAEETHAQKAEDSGMKTIRYYAPLRGIVKQEAEQTELGSVKEVLAYIEKTYGEEAFLAAKSALIVVNDVSIGLFLGMKTPLNDGDVLGFLPVCGGG